MRTLSHLPLATLLLASFAAAQITTASRQLGGAGGLTSCGAFNPPTLCDGVTLASANVSFTFDAGTNTLTLVLDNTSPVVVGVANPVITNFYFNVAPGGVTGMALTGQSAIGGAAPNWALTFDANLQVNPNPNVADGFGRFHVRLEGATGNALANPLADTLAVPPGSAILGPATFVFAVTPATGATLNAETFANAFSNGPNVNRQVNLAAHFQAGGPNSESAYITNAQTCAPSGFMTGTPCLGCQVTFRMTAATYCAGCLLVSADPGPILVTLPPPTGFVSIPIGVPFDVLINTSIPPASTVVSQTVTIPNDPFLVGFTIYGLVAMLNLNSGLFSFSDQFQFVIVP